MTTKAEAKRASRSTIKRRARSSTTPAPTLAVVLGISEITPLSVREFTRGYRLTDKSAGLEIHADESVTTCSECAWCTEHIDAMAGEISTHTVRAPNKFFLSLSIDGMTSVGGEMGGVQLHAVIEHLCTLRDRLVMDGVISPRTVVK